MTAEKNPLDQDVTTIELEIGRFLLPKCCENADDDCPHVAKKEREKKRNIAL